MTICSFVRWINFKNSIISYSLMFGTCNPWMIWWPIIQLFGWLIHYILGYSYSSSLRLSLSTCWINTPSFMKIMRNWPSYHPGFQVPVAYYFSFFNFSISILIWNMQHGCLSSFCGYISLASWERKDVHSVTALGSSYNHLLLLKSWDWINFRWDEWDVNLTAIRTYSCTSCATQHWMSCGFISGDESNIHSSSCEEKTPWWKSII